MWINVSFHPLQLWKLHWWMSLGHRDEQLMDIIHQLNGIRTMHRRRVSCIQLGKVTVSSLLHTHLMFSSLQWNRRLFYVYILNIWMTTHETVVFKLHLTIWTIWLFEQNSAIETDHIWHQLTFLSLSLFYRPASFGKIVWKQGVSVTLLW